MSKIAIIDMGSNTFHLLIARLNTSGYSIVARYHEAVKLGRGGINAGVILPEACERAIHAMRQFKTAIEEHGAEEILAFGTSAMRSAANGGDLARAIREQTGIHVRIIDGNEEASFIHAGIAAALDLDDANSLIVDIGAGSVEFIVANRRQVFWKRSFEIGGQRLLERFHHHDPILPDEIDALNGFLAETLAPLLEAMQLHNPRTLVGASGTFDTLSDIYCIRQCLPAALEAPERPLTVAAFHEMHQALISQNRDQRMAIPGMIDMRVDMIVVTSCLIRFLLERQAFDRIRVSSWSLKEGVLALRATAGDQTRGRV